MENRRTTMAEMVLAALPGWCFLLSGLALIGMALLTPAWLCARQVQWQRQLMQVQAKQLAKQQRKYKQFAAALKANNPTVLERLAFAELQEQPANTTVLGPKDAANRGPADEFGALPTAKHWHGSAKRFAPPNGDASPEQSAVQTWLSEPMPRAGVNVPAYRPPNTRLVRLCSGNNRWWVLAAGSLCLLGGVWWKSKW